MSPVRLYARRLLLVAAGFGLYAHASPLFAVVLALTATLDWALARYASPAGTAGRVVTGAVGVIVNLGAIAVLARLYLWTDWLAAHADWAGPIVGEGGAVALIPVGISLLFAQGASHALDVARGRAAPIRAWLDHLAFASFFPRFAAGPMMRAETFVPRIASPLPLGPKGRGEVIARLMAGSVKLVIADHLALNVVDKVFDLPTLFSTTEVILALYGQAVVIYLALSGASDWAVGLGMALGFEMPENFRSPYAAGGPRAFWRRWMIPLTGALRDHVYRPLAGESGRVRGAIAAFAPPLLVALLLGADDHLFAFAGLAGLWSAASILVRGRRTGKEPGTAWRVLGVFVTLHLAVVLWAVFKAHNGQTVSDILAILPLGIWSSPNLNLSAVAVFGTSLIACLMPALMWDRAREAFSRWPLPAQILVAALVAWLLFQARQVSEIPFVYERL